MKERPILFRPEMVKAILDGRKTQTRRLIKPQPGDVPAGAYMDAYAQSDKWCFWTLGNRVVNDVGPTPDTCMWLCPYGQPGDKLWVRETWLKMDLDHWEEPARPCEWIHTRYSVPRCNGIAYAADTTKDGDEIRREYGYKWKPSIHMPRWASRLTLEIVKVRVERVQDITWENAAAEGVAAQNLTKALERGEHLSEVNRFRDLWDRIHSKDGHDWNANPWLWVIEFKVAK